MSPMEALIHHLDNRPELPRPVPPVDSPAWQAWRKAFTQWALQKESIEIDIRIGKATCVIPKSFGSRVYKDVEPIKDGEKPCRICGAPRFSAKKAYCYDCELEQQRKVYALKGDRKKARREAIRQAVLDTQKERDAR